MDAIEALLTRRSVRHFKSQAIPDEEIETILRAAMHAPSANNQQPWHFVVLKERSVLEGVMEFQPYSSMLKEAPMAILVCGDQRLERSPGKWVQDCSAATQNLLLAAHARGLGAVWINLHPDPERVKGMKNLVPIPPEVIPLCLVAVGYPSKPLPKADRFRPERIHFNQW